MNKPSILIVDDEAIIRETIKADLMDAGYQTKMADGGDEGLALLESNPFDLLITDLIMEKGGVFELMEKVLEINPQFPVIILSGYGTVPLAVKAMNSGAYWFMEKPYSNDMLLKVIRRAIKNEPKVQKFYQRNRDLYSASGQVDTIIGESAAIVELKRNVCNVCKSDANIIIEGETGTGKDLIAKFLHVHSKRSTAEFVAINCASFPESIAESELFGHEAGAFTGADHRQIGKFEFAKNGTVFLDEIDSMSLNMQVKLLRVLEEKTIQRLGSNEKIAIDVRILAASQIDLEEASNQGKFRIDLFYRLNVGNIKVPPLRERLEDIPVLFNHFSYLLSSKYQCPLPEFSNDLMQDFMSRDWPGNIREFRNEVEKLFLKESFKASNQPDSENLSNESTKKEGNILSQRVSNFERTLIEFALKRHKGNIKKVQEALEIPRPTLNDKIKKYGLKRDDYL
jgi:two-component system, NtrC family, C4-dicarboxylate transport response regulator DctD